mmetsp:Transcript_51511/g.151878  ORF Transcript_51511/g.151878 Transcript_51511/m.151878 type:complete len:284 (-) Transcript_51511:134-985(-)
MEQCCAEPPAVPTRDPADAWDAALDPARHSMSNSHVGVDDDEFTGALLEAHKHLLLVLLRDLGGRQALEVEVDKLVGTPLRVRVLVAPHDHVLHECRPRGVVHLRGHISQHLPQQRRQLLLVELSAAILIVRCKEVARALLLLERSHLLDRLLREFGANLLASEKLVVELFKLGPSERATLILVEVLEEHVEVLLVLQPGQLEVERLEQRVQLLNLQGAAVVLVKLLEHCLRLRLVASSHDRLQLSIDVCGELLDGLWWQGGQVGQILQRRLPHGSCRGRRRL